MGLYYPCLSMFISDLLYQVLYIGGISTIQGFYEGQWQNYILFTLLVFVGFAIKKLNLLQIVAASLAAPTIYFLISNFMVWAVIAVIGDWTAENLWRTHAYVIQTEFHFLK